MGSLGERKSEVTRNNYTLKAVTVHPVARSIKFREPEQHDQMFQSFPISLTQTVHLEHFSFVISLCLSLCISRDKYLFSPQVYFKRNKSLKVFGDFNYSI